MSDLDLGAIVVCYTIGFLTGYWAAFARASRIERERYTKSINPCHVGHDWKFSGLKPVITYDDYGITSNREDQILKCSRCGKLKQERLNEGER